VPSHGNHIPISTRMYILVQLHSGDVKDSEVGSSPQRVDVEVM
jgi:hypothetical protein